MIQRIQFSFHKIFSYDSDKGSEVTWESCVTPSHGFLNLLLPIEVTFHLSQNPFFVAKLASHKSLS